MIYKHSHEELLNKVYQVPKIVPPRKWHYYNTDETTPNTSPENKNAQEHSQNFHIGF